MVSIQSPAPSFGESLSPGKIDLDLNQATPPLTGNGWIYTRDETGGVAALDSYDELTAAASRGMVWKTHRFRAGD
ncbi:MAG: hypothetical protein R2855_04800 [Thermomicrobiales bacterium]